MFYAFLKVLVRFVLKIFFRKIYISGLEFVSDTKAQLVSSNHPNGFLEPLIMACFFPKPLHFLVRGDVFENPLIRPLLVSTNQIPIFRFRDGFTKMRENSQTMDDSIQVMLDRKNLLIFAEGGTQSIKKLRPLQKGIARIAFQALEKNPDLNLEVLPVGINFTYPSHFNAEVMLKIGPPIQVADFENESKSDNKQSTEQLLDAIYLGMKNNMVHLEDQHKKHLLEKLLILERSKLNISYLPVHINDPSRLQSEIELASKLSNCKEDRLNKIEKDLDNLEAQLIKHKLKPGDLLKSNLTIARLLILVVGALPAFIGLLFNGLPMLLAYLFREKKVKQIEFKASILMIANLIFFLLYYIIIILLLFLCRLPFWYLLVIVGCGLWLRYFYEIYTSTLFFTGKKITDELKHTGIKILSHL
ncbi:MAG: 1-acyl-sn-glycerol-3-phosphate acyltransferase [Saprospiraceae bacterium]|nr:1-acyl-sn-glycerol-3-phosphate acyltransferase [Saprospiraceae bacterium]